MKLQATLAEWLSLDEIAVSRRGGLARALADLDTEAVRAELGGYLTQLRDLLGGSAAGGRDALRALLGESLLLVGPDAERGFKVEGTVWLDPRAGVQDSVVAGAGFDTGETSRIKVRLPWAA